MLASNLYVRDSRRLNVSAHALLHDRLTRSEEDAHARIQNDSLRQFGLIGWMYQHLYVRPNLGVLSEPEPVKRLEDIFVWFAEV